MIVRDAKPEDAKAIAEICTTSLGYATDADYIEKKLRAINPEFYKTFVAEADGRVIGFVQAEEYRLIYEDDMVNILGLAVSKDAQGRGAGKLLMARVEEWAKDIGCEAIRLNSGMERLGAHEFYKHIGFELIKEHKTFRKQLVG